MRVLIAESFLASVARLQGRAAADVKRAAFDFLTSPDQPGLHLHRLVHAVDRGFWSLRAGRDLRVIVHRSGADAVLCHADHHDRAYAWAAHRVWNGASVRLPAVDVEAGDASRDAAVRTEPPQRFAPDEPFAAGEVPAEPPTTSPRRERTRQRAVAPLMLEAPRSGRGGSAPPPLLELLRFVRQARPDPGPPWPCPAPEPAPRGSPKAAARAEPVALVALAVLAVMAVAFLVGAGPASAARIAHGAVAQGVVLLLLVAGLRRHRELASRQARAELAHLAVLLRAGRLEARADPAQVGASLRAIVEQANAAVEAAAAPALAMGAAVTALSRGERAPPLDGLPEALTGPRAAVEMLSRFLVLEPDDIRLLAGRAS